MDVSAVVALSPPCSTGSPSAAPADSGRAACAANAAAVPAAAARSARRERGAAASSGMPFSCDGTRPAGRSTDTDMSASGRRLCRVSVPCSSNSTVDTARAGPGASPDGRSDGSVTAGMSMLPTGPAVTFFFSDIEGSTRLAHDVDADAWEALLAEHDRLVDETVVAAGGVVVKHEGDG